MPESSNDYVRLTISYCLAFFQEDVAEYYPNLAITIHADNDFYSQPSCSTYEDLVKLPKFSPLNKAIPEVNKTGLGSSAALITALTGALVSIVGQLSLSSPSSLRLVHNLAQAAHCAAQGKVGSGFDIAAAAYGSCIYRRFDPSILQPILLDSNIYSNEFREQLRAVVHKEWEMQIIPFKLPSGLRVVMGDVTGGSATPSMVRSVLNWKDKYPDAPKLWKSLGATNRRFIHRIADIPVSDKRDVVDELDQGLHKSRTTLNKDLYHTLNEVSEDFDVSLLSCLTTDIAGGSETPPFNGTTSVGSD
jgi:phosphomevalonate kinase